MSDMVFSATVIQGAGRGRQIGAPTINVDLHDVPADIEEGIYAGWIDINGTWQKAAIHFGPRPVFNDTTSFEAHVLDAMIDITPARVTISLVERIRPVMDFPDSEALMDQIQSDVERTRGILDKHGPPTTETADS